MARVAINGIGSNWQGHVENLAGDAGTSTYRGE